MQGSGLHCNYMSTSNFKEQTSRRKTDIIIKTKLCGYFVAVLLTRLSSFWSQLQNLPQNICELKSEKKSFFPVHCIGVPKEAKMLRRLQFCEYCKDCLTVSQSFSSQKLWRHPLWVIKCKVLHVLMHGNLAQVSECFPLSGSAFARF